LAEQSLAEKNPLSAQDEIPAYVIRPNQPIERRYQPLRRRPTLWRTVAQALSHRATSIPVEPGSVAPLEGPFADLLADNVSSGPNAFSLKLPRWTPGAGALIVASVAIAFGVSWKLSSHGHAPAAHTKPAAINAQGTTAPGEIKHTALSAAHYTVKAGDSYTTIGAHFHLKPHTVRVANGLPLGRHLKAGRTLIIPPVDGLYHPIRSGETFGHLAIRYQVSEAKLLAFNPGLRPQTLKLGQRVFIPGAVALRTAPVAPKLRALLKHETVKTPATAANKPAPTAPSRGYRRHHHTTASRGLVGGLGNRVGHLLWPAPGEISSPFGARGSSFHPGIDICNHEGTVIRAARSGIVMAAGWNPGGYGNAVDIDHGGGLMTRIAPRYWFIPGKASMREKRSPSWVAPVIPPGRTYILKFAFQAGPSIRSLIYNPIASQ
jgi:murein DD-endopeptidase MepM/ murein hydrolase activator NlpD